MNFFNVFIGPLSLFIFSFFLSLAGQTAGLDGWTHHLEKLNDDLPVDKSYVFVMTHPSRSAISYASPKHLKDSLIHQNNTYYEIPEKFIGDIDSRKKNDRKIILKSPESVGHTTVAWRCSYEGKRYSGMTAYGGETQGQVQAMIDAGFGLSGLFATYTDGYFFKPSPNRGEDDYFGSLFYMSNPESGPKRPMDMKWLGFEVSAGSCFQAVLFVNNFLAQGWQRNHPDTGEPPVFNFGFNFDPNSLEGAGCSSFAKTFLDSAGVLGFASKYWTRQLRIPKELLGYPGEDLLPAETHFPLTPQYTSLARRNQDFTSLIGSDRSLLELFFKPWHEPRSQDIGFNLDLVDVELLHFTIGEVERLVAEKTQLVLTDFNLEPRHEVRYFPNSQSKSVAIDRQLDDHTNAINRSLLQNLKFSSRKFSISEINNVKGLIINN